MSNVGFKGVDCRQTGAELVFRAFLQTSAGALVTSGITNLYLMEIQSDGTIKTYDFNDNTFKTTAVTTEALAMTYRKSNNATTDTGLWTAALATLSGFTVGAVYLIRVNNSGAFPTDQMREFQYGSAEGDLQTTAVSTGVANVSADLQTIKAQTVTCAAGVTILANVGFAAAPGAANGGLIAGSNAATTFTGTAAVGATPAKAALTLVGGAASITAGGTAAPAISATGGSGAASTNGAASAVIFQGGGTNTVTSSAHGLSLIATSAGSGLSGLGSTIGSGILAVGGGGGTSPGMQLTGGSAGGAGLSVNGVGTDAATFFGDGSGDGIHCQGGDTGGNGMHLATGGTTGSGLLCVASGNSAGIDVAGAGSGAGIRALGGTTGDGMKLIGQGAGKDFNATTTPLVVAGIAGTTQTLDALQTALSSAHGAGSWATATGFATPTDISNLQTHGDSAWATATGFALASVWTAPLATALNTLASHDPGSTLASHADIAGLPTTAQIATAVLTTQMSESYPALHTAPTLAQSQFMLMQRVTDQAFPGTPSSTTTATVYHLDGTTPAYTLTVSLDGSGNAISSTRAT